MHWILTVSDAFSLTQLIQRSGWLLNVPFSTGPAQENLHRVERLYSGKILALSISQVPAGLILHASERLDSKEVEELSHKTWRMLRLGEQHHPFLEKARRTPGLESVIHKGSRFLRGATFFEDVVKSTILAYTPDDEASQCITWLVDRFGDPLPSNPTRHAFPIPKQLLKEGYTLQEKCPPLLSEQLLRAADNFRLQGDYLNQLAQADIPLDVLEASLHKRLELNPETLGLVMLHIGRYDYVPVDRRAQLRIGRYWRASGNAISPDKIRELLAPWCPWGGLVYWLWDWDADAPFVYPQESEIGYENTTNGTNEHGKLANRCRAS